MALKSAQASTCSAINTSQAQVDMNAPMVWNGKEWPLKRMGYLAASYRCTPALPMCPASQVAAEIGGGHPSQQVSSPAAPLFSGEPSARCALYQAPIAAISHNKHNHGSCQMMAAAATWPAGKDAPHRSSLHAHMHPHSRPPGGRQGSFRGGLGACGLCAARSSN